MAKQNKVTVELSARHLHLSEKHLAKLFGANYQLTQFKRLSEPYEFAAQETVTLKTKDGELPGLRIIGPVREQTQVELSLTDCRKLKISPPIRLSGDIKGSTGGMLIGPKGQVKLAEGIIAAMRHIHCDPATAKKLGLKNKQKVKVRIGGERGLILENVPVRVSEKFIFRCHLDTDEGNACNISENNNQGEIL